MSNILQHIFKELFIGGDDNAAIMCYNIMLRIRDIEIKDYIAMVLIYILRYKYSDVPSSIYLTNIEIAICAMILGAKMVVDQPHCYNEIFARESHLSFIKVGMNEVEFCKKLKFVFHISPEEYAIAHGIIDSISENTTT